MNREEAIKLLRGGPEGVAEWNRWREAGGTPPPLEGADLSESNLHGVNLSGAKLQGAKFWDANFSGPGIPCHGDPSIDTERVHASAATYHAGRGGKLFEADLRKAEFGRAHLVEVTLDGADLSEADFISANLYTVDLSNAFLNHTKFRHALLKSCTLSHCHMDYADFYCAEIGGVTFTSLDLREVRNLDTVKGWGPSFVHSSSFVESAGRVPCEFLRACGLTPWEAHASRLHDPELSAAEVNDLIYKIFDLRTDGLLFIGGAFISYSHTDSKFALKLYKSLTDAGANPYLDRHDFVAGPLQEQVDRAIGINDAVVLVLSEASINSDWVEHELEMARKKEKKEGRDVLCPVALDESWKDKMNDVLWRQIKKKNVLDFSKWKTKAFGPQFEKLLKGLKMYYPPSTNEGEP